jgi:hypothetical protein
MTTRIAAIVMCLALAGCGAPRAQQTKTVAPGAQVTLAPGAGVSVKDAQLEVRFVAVTEDSRCPADVTCIWAGEIKAQIEIRQNSQPASRVEILEGGSTVAGGYRVTVVRVEPQRVSSAPVAPQDYRVTMNVDKAD